MKLLFSAFAALLLSVSCNTYAQQATVNYAEAVNKAGKQRMLSQRIAKAYLFLGERVRTDKSKRQLEASVKEFLDNHKYLKSKIQFKGVQDMLAFVEFSIQEYADLAKQPYSKDNAFQMIDLSETLLEASQDIVVKIETLAKTKKSKIVNISGRQRMLSQRIAKYYIAYQAGFTDDNTTQQLQNAVSQFEAAQDTLIKSALNTKEITQQLTRTKRLWNIVRGFFLDLKEGDLPVTVYATTDTIMKNMNTVTGMYTQVTEKT